MPAGVDTWGRIINPYVRRRLHAKIGGFMTTKRNHGEGLKEDLVLIERQLQRRHALKLFGAAAGLAALGGGSRLFAPTGALAATAQCTADAPETAGPYPADGTNHATGETSDVLTESGVVRKDIRRSFLSTRTKAKGIPVHLELTVIDTNSGCVPVSGFAVYIWQCDRDALYSLYTIATESYLRGVQVSDESGHLSFKTIFPACYPGRWPHMHLEIFASLDGATNGRNSILTTQLALPAEVCSEVYGNAKGYERSIQNFANITLQEDSVFGDDNAAQLKVMTPKFRGSVRDGYTAKATLGVPV
jgi:protocatechuate 3,4-dioxygenase beta subunit